MRNLLFTILLSFFLFQISSCGPSAEERAQIQQQREDSIKNAIEHKYAIENEFKESNQKLQNLRSQLENERANLEVENAKMNDLKGFKFLRTENEKEQQIKDQSLKIQSIQDNIAALEKNMTQIQEQLSSLESEIKQYK